MERLEVTPELLDGPLDGRLLAGNLRDLARVNRWLGGADLSWQAMSPFLAAGAGARPLQLIDVGTGAADIPRRLLARATARDRSLEITATDVRPEIIELARMAGPPDARLVIELSGEDRIAAPDDAYDISHASMVIHHLDRPAAIRALSELGRVARRAVVINDLDRRWHWWAGAWLLSHLLTGNRYTRHDAPLSVRRGYTVGELIGLARAAGLRPVAEHRSRPGYRYAVVLVRPDAGRAGRG